MKRIIKTAEVILAFTFLVTMVMPFGTVASVYASTQYVNAAKKINNSKEVSTGRSVVTAKVTKKNKYNFVRFKAAKSRTYTFSFSNYKPAYSQIDQEDNITLARFGIAGIKKGKAKLMKIETGSGKGSATDTICSSRGYRLARIINEKDNYSKKTYAKVSLKKGDIVLVTSSASENMEYSYRLVIR